MSNPIPDTNQFLSPLFFQFLPPSKKWRKCTASGRIWSLWRWESTQSTGGSTSKTTRCRDHRRKPSRRYSALSRLSSPPPPGPWFGASAATDASWQPTNKTRAGAPQVAGRARCSVVKERGDKSSRRDGGEGRRQRAMAPTSKGRAPVPTENFFFFSLSKKKILR